MGQTNRAWTKGTHKYTNITSANLDVNIVMAIVTTILCCLPFGIVSLVYANRVNTKFHMGDYAGALEASNKAKTWWIVAMVCGVVAILVYLIAVAGLMSSSGTSG